MNNLVRYRAPFLAMAKLKQALLCSFGLTKAFAIAHPFSSWQSQSKLCFAHLTYESVLMF